MRPRDRVIVVDERTSLHPRTPSDCTEMYAIVERDRTDLRRWLTWIDATNSEGDARQYARFAEQQFRQGDGFDYAIRVDGEIAGAIGLYNLDWTQATAQIGYWLRPAARGQGVMTAACAAITTHAFTQLHLHRLEIRCVVENAPSRAVAERLEYRLEGILHEAYALHGGYRDLAVYAMTASRWDPVKSAALADSAPRGPGLGSPNGAR